MATAMKKLKLLHQLTTSPTSQYPQHQHQHQHQHQEYNQHHHHHHNHHHHHSQQQSRYHHKLPTTPPSSSSSPADKPKKQHHRSRIPVPTYYQQPTPPISPTGSSVSNSTPPSPQQNERRKPETSTQTKNYADMLRSARQALHQLQHQHVPPPVTPQQRSIYPVIPELHQQQPHQKRLPALPGGAFLVLTQDDPHPAICIPNSPAPSQQQQQTIRPFIPPISVNAQTTAPTSRNTSAPPQTPTRSKRRPPPLTKSAVEQILQDTRMARWQRVNGYVREQRKLVLNEQAEERRNGTRKASLVIPGAENPIEGEGYPWAQYVYGWTNESANRAVLVGEPFAEMDRKNELLEALDDLPEIKNRSLWSGGSAGTNGVDEFVWDDDEEGFVGDADMLDVGDWGNRERERMKKEYQAQQAKMHAEIQLQMKQLQAQQAIDERFMREEEARKAVEDHRRRYQRTTPGATPPRTPTSPQQRQHQVQATPPQLKAYTTSFFKSKSHLNGASQRSSRQESYHPRPGTSGSGSASPGYKRQSIGRGIIAGGSPSSGKTGSFGSVDGAVFRMDGEAMDVDQGLPLPSSYFVKPSSSPRTPFQPSYTNPTFSSLGKSRGTTSSARSPVTTGSPMDKGLREYMEALRRYEVRFAADAEGGEGSGSSRRRRRSSVAAGGYHY